MAVTDTIYLPTSVIEYQGKPIEYTLADGRVVTITVKEPSKNHRKPKGK